MKLSKDILVQYCEMREEIKDLRDRIDRDQRRLEWIREEGIVFGYRERHPEGWDHRADQDHRLSRTGI